MLAAEGWALATGDTGVAAVTAGPGFANGLIGLLDAAAWSVPLVMLAGRTSRNRQGRGAVADVDQRAIAAPIAKWAASCSDAGTDTAVCRRGDASRPQVGAPAPCTSRWIPTPCTARRLPSRSRRPGFPTAPLRPAGAPADIGAAVAALAAAERPLIVAGSGAFWSDAGAEIGRLRRASPRFR